MEPKDEATSTYTLEEVAAIVEQSRREGTLDTRRHPGRAFEFTDRSAADIEVPLADLVLLPASAAPPTSSAPSRSTATPATSWPTTTGSPSGTST